jgi:hypothetical protein
VGDAGSDQLSKMSHHYNETRSEYYRQLHLASRSKGDVIPFIRYAVQGLDGNAVGQGP